MKVAWETEVLNASTAKDAIKQRSGLVGLVHCKSDRCEREAAFESISAQLCPGARTLMSSASLPIPTLPSEQHSANTRRLHFFHEYGRRVGMVPRSSLKEGKNRQMVEKGTKTPKPTQNKHPSPQAETPPSCSLSSTLGETCETETSGN